jgi:heme/copper-type cytochrome/quinol oxidase subunit 4
MKNGRKKAITKQSIWLIIPGIFLTLVAFTNAAEAMPTWQKFEPSTILSFQNPLSVLSFSGPQNLAPLTSTFSFNLNFQQASSGSIARGVIGFVLGTFILGVIFYYIMKGIGNTLLLFIR